METEKSGIRSRRNVGTGSESGKRVSGRRKEKGRNRNIQSEAEGGIETSVGNMSEGRKYVGTSGMCRILTEGGGWTSNGRPLVL